LVNDDDEIITTWIDDDVVIDVFIENVNNPSHLWGSVQVVPYVEPQPEVVLASRVKECTKDVYKACKQKAKGLFA
jgi:hypothetical protein